MKLRTQLIAAFVLLAILPLTGIVLFNYLSSVRTFRRLVEAESSQLTQEIEQNVATARASLQSRWRGLGDALPRELMGGEKMELASEALREAIESLGEDARWFKGVEIIPEVPLAVLAPTRGGITVVTGGEPGEAEATVVGAPEFIESVVITIEPQALSEGALPPPSRPGSTTIARREATRARIEHERLRLDAALETLHEELERQTEGSRDTAGEDLHSQMDRAMESFALQQKIAQLNLKSRRMKRLLGAEFRSTIEGFGSLHADINLQLFFRGVLARTRRQHGELPFAIDDAGELYTTTPDEKERLLEVFGGAEGLNHVLSGLGAYTELDGWVLATRDDPQSGLTFGIARPIAQSISEMQRTSGRNLLLGVAMIGLSLFGILPFSRRMSSRLKLLTHEAMRVASGDLRGRAPVRGRDEIGQLGQAFNQMATDLEAHQQQLIEQERRGRERELSRRLLEAENQRRGEELEEARRFQLSMLPADIPVHPRLEVAVYMKTATEVGGDYYDFSTADEALTAVIGDATGHGARAGTMVTVIKTLFASRGAEGSLVDFLSEATRAIKSMGFERMTMALALARFREDRLEIASAGMPPALLYRAAPGELEELAVAGLPLGAMAETTYRSLSARIDPGDTVLLMSDGFPELPDRKGEPIGYAPVQRLFSEVATLEPAQIIERLGQAVEEQTQGAAPVDDVTFVIVRRRS